MGTVPRQFPNRRRKKKCADEVEQIKTQLGIDDMLRDEAVRRGKDIDLDTIKSKIDVAIVQTFLEVDRV